MPRKVSMTLFTIVALALAVGLATGLSPYASADPDGLEKVAEEKGFIEEGKLAKVQEDSPIPDYAFPGIDNARVATGVAGFVGTLVVFALGFGLAWILRRMRGSARTEPAAST